MPGQDTSDKRQAAREVIDILHEIATLLVSQFRRVNVNILTDLPRRIHTLIDSSCPTASHSLRMVSIQRL